MSHPGPFGGHDDDGGVQASATATLDPPSTTDVTSEPPDRFCVCGHQLHVGVCLARLPDRCSCLGGREATASWKAYDAWARDGRDDEAPDWLVRAVDALRVWSSM